MKNKAHNILCGLKIGHISNSKITGGATAPPAPPVSWSLLSKQVTSEVCMDDNNPMKICDAEVWRMLEKFSSWQVVLQIR